MTEQPVKVAILDNSLWPELYNPVLHWSKYLKVPWQAFRLQDGCLPDLQNGFTHVILTGSEASIVDREDWVLAEVEFVRRAFERGLAILGSCYGHQLLALALAGQHHIRRSREPEVGWIAVRILKPSRLLGPRGVTYCFSVHFDEVFDLEDPFLVLASTAICPVQAFTLKNRPVWGLQTHPEIDIPTARRLLCDFSGLNSQVQSLYEKAIASTPRDSGLIRRIVRTFLAAIPEDL